MLAVKGAAEAKRVEDQFSRIAASIDLQRRNLGSLIQAYSQGQISAKAYAAEVRRIEEAITREERAQDRLIRTGERLAYSQERTANRTAAAQERAAARTAAARRQAIGSAARGAIGGAGGAIGDIASTDVSGISSAIGGGLSAVGGVVTSVASKFALLTGAIGATGLALGGIAIHEAVLAEAQLSKLRKTSGLTGQALEDVRAQLARLATTFGGMDYSELLGIGAMGARLGVAAKDIGNFTRDVGLMTIALDDIPGEEAATKIQRTLNVFQISTKHALDFAAALNILDDTSTATGREILDVTQRLAGPAAALGLAPQKVMALAAAMKDAGIQSEVAGTVMSQVLSLMASHPEKFAEVAGMSMQKFARVMRADPLQALIAFERGLKRLDGMSQLQVLDDMGLHGARVKTSLLQLSQVLDKIPGYVQAGSREWRTHTRLMGEVDVASNTTEAQLKRMGQNFQQLMIEIGNLALPTVRTFADALSRITGGFKDIVAANKGVVENIAKPFQTAIRYSGLLVSNFRDLVDLGKEFVGEKFDQLTTILGRVQEQLGPNLKAVATNAMVDFVHAVAKGSILLGPIFMATGELFVEVWDRAGKQAMAKLVNPMKLAFVELQHVLDQIMTVNDPKGRAKVDFEAAQARHKLQVEMGMGQGGFAALVGPGMARFGAAQQAIQNQAEAGRVAVPGFNGLMANLPNRQDRIAPIVGGLQQAGQVAAAADEAARQAQRPRVAINDYAGMGVQEILAAQRNIARNLRDNAQQQAVARQQWMMDPAQGRIESGSARMRELRLIDEGSRMRAQAAQTREALPEARQRARGGRPGGRINLPNTAIPRDLEKRPMSPEEKAARQRAGLDAPGPQAANQIGEATARVATAMVAAITQQRKDTAGVMSRLAVAEKALRGVRGLTQQTVARSDQMLPTFIPQGLI